MNSKIVLFFFFPILAWLSSRGEDEGFENYENTKLNEMLEIFDTEPKEGGDYSKSSLVSIREGLNRHFKNLSQNKKRILMNSPELASSKRMIYAVLYYTGLDLRTS